MADLQWTPGFTERQRESNRRTPRINPQELEEAMGAPKVHIWNVFPRKFEEDRGSLGRFIIPACPEGADISEPLVINGWVFETAVDQVDGSDITYKWLKTSGRELARDIIGVGPGKHESQRYAKFGVFISAGVIPSEEELIAAYQLRDTYYAELVRQADQAYELNGGTEIDDRGIPKPSITKDHIQAGKALQLDRPWLRKQGRMVSCENCGKSNVPTASRCVQCQAVFDEVKDRRLFPRDYQNSPALQQVSQVAAPAEIERRGPGRPRREEVNA